jgi:hypothetical protein
MPTSTVLFDERHIDRDSKKTKPLVAANHCGAIEITFFFFQISTFDNDNKRQLISVLGLIQNRDQNFRLFDFFVPNEQKQKKIGQKNDERKNTNTHKKTLSRDSKPN